MILLRNQRGDAFIFALIMVAAAGIIFLGTQVVQDSVQSRLNLFRIRSQMTLMEQRIRQALLQPQAYEGCQASAQGSRGCALNMAFLHNFARFPAIGLPCSVTKSSSCGFTVKNWDLNLSRAEVKVALEFSGGEQIRSSLITVQVPEEILQSQIFNCPTLDPTKPVFMGIEPKTGRILCRALTQCGVGEYMTGVTADQAATICRSIPRSIVSCGQDKLISKFAWKGTSFDSSCADRLDPFSYFGGP